jgi:site-specific recombinase XerD
VMRTIGDRAQGHRLRALIVLLWRAGLRISEALSLQEAIWIAFAVRCWSGVAKAASVTRSAWTDGPGTSSSRSSRSAASSRSGRLLCVIHGPTAGRRWEASAARKQLHHAAAAAGVRRRFAPHQLRHAHAVEMAHEGVPLVVIQRQLGHAILGITSIYLQGIDSSEIISTVHGRPSPTISASAGLKMRR